MTDLVKNLLGPRGGVTETLDNQHMPIFEYITGVLSPMDDTQSDTVRDFNVQGFLPSNISEMNYEADDSGDDNIASMLNPSLNPQKMSSTMGISFQATASGSPEFDVCLTWARYLPDSKSAPNWIRSPRYALLEISGDRNDEFHFDSSGKKCPKSDAEISFYLKSRSTGGNTFFISLFLVNVTKIQDDKQTAKYHVFQPQIRIVRKQGTEIMPIHENASDSESSKDRFLYRNRKFFARGHMTSAVWRQIDPEIISNDLKNEFVDRLNNPGFLWVDSAIIPADKAKKFLESDLRTEYIPMYSIPSPDVEWQGDANDKPVLSANDYSQMWNKDKLKEVLEPISRQYAKWILGLDKTKDGTNDKLVDEITSECSTVLKRIDSGIQLLMDDDDARLAFCFANMAINLQSQWGRKSDMIYRPFQIAFILMSIESIINTDSKFRDTCDLLWVPTGAGKTEAYLALVAMDMAYRRIQSIKHGKSGAGVSVFTRYTLRLLTIQQFRRSLAMFSAAEYLRVANLDKRKSIGWRPEGFTSSDSFIWGSTPFSVGLWVGQGVTPNKLGDSGMMKNGRFSSRPGALTILRQNPRDPSGEGEPAQVLDCPACKNILAVPLNKGGHGMGLQAKKPHSINWIIQSDSKIDLLNSAINDFVFSGYKIIETKFVALDSDSYFVLKITFESDSNVDAQSLNDFWYQLQKHLQNKDSEVFLQSTSAARPGYFYKTYLNQKNRLVEYDFEIICTSNSCPLKVDWIGGSPMGGVNSTVPTPESLTNNSDGVVFNDGNMMLEINRCFKKSDFISDRIPIPGLTVDEQVYKTLPTMVVSTVDKFARLPFQPNAGGLFGNVEYCHMLAGFYRLIDKHPQPEGRNTKYYRQLSRSEIPKPPNFVIQDELHLIEGPLGSMVGLYESCVDFLSSRPKCRLKYIASTATIKHGGDQVLSLFSRDLQVFPPSGTDVDDRFFIRESEEHALVDKKAGRLYLGVMAPGKGALTPIVRIWSCLAQTAYENRNDPEIDRFWTITGYFNAVRELAGARSLYRQDIPERINEISPTSHRLLPEDNAFELSGRTPSDALPSILDMMNKKYPEAADGLFTTSMFGTGVDVSRIGLMIVNGQPKTTSSYIQSTGRVGREKGALVVVFHRATRPRDLSHYEYFLRHHRQLHRTVESPTVYPFSSGAVERALGPITVGMLRNMRTPVTNWCEKNSAISMRTDYANSEIKEIVNFLEERSQRQPEKRKPSTSKIYNESNRCIEKWRDVSANVNDIEYYEIDKAEKAVVLGDLLHENEDSPEAVFSNSPQSLRELEGETGFET